jgi:hypothetical protein
MIDFATYKELHPDNEYSRRTQISSNVDEYSPGDNQGPQAPEMYLFPTMVPGFDLRRKIWGKFNRYWQVVN